MIRLTTIALLLSATTTIAAEGRDPTNAWSAFIAGGESNGMKVEEVEPSNDPVGSPETTLEFNTQDSKGTSWTYTITQKDNDIELSYTNNETGASSGGMNVEEASEFQMDNF